MPLADKHRALVSSEICPQAAPALIGSPALSGCEEAGKIALAIFITLLFAAGAVTSTRSDQPRC